MSDYKFKLVGPLLIILVLGFANQGLFNSKALDSQDKNVCGVVSSLTLNDLSFLRLLPTAVATIQCTETDCFNMLLTEYSCSGGGTWKRCDPVPGYYCIISHQYGCWY